MEQIPPEECTSKLFEAVHLFINYSVQDYISRGIIQANEKPRFMRELWGQLEQSALKKTALSTIKPPHPLVLRLNRGSNATNSRK
ncbi:TPA: hypothetical protein ACPPQ4_000794 [Haemophilus influenzae]